MNIQEKLKAHHLSVMKKLDAENQAFRKTSGGRGRRMNASNTELYGSDGMRRDYFEPTATDVHVDGPLSNLSVMYSNDSYIAERLFPILPVQKDSDLFFTYDQGDFLRDSMARRQPGSNADDEGYALVTSTYAVVERALAHIIPWDVRDNADTPLSPRRDGVDFVMEKALIGRERRVANQVRSISNVGSGVALAGTNQWSDYNNSDPFADVRTGVNFVRQNTGRIVNTIAMGRQVWDTLLDHPDVLGRLPDIRSKSKAEAGSALSGLFGIDQVLIGDAIVNLGIKGEANSLADIWGGDVVLAYTDAPGLRKPVGGMTFTKFGRRIRSGSDTRAKFDWVEVEESTDERIIVRNLIYTLTTAV